MAINTGVAPHFAWIVINGTPIPIISGSVDQLATRKTSKFGVRVAMNYPGVMPLLATLGQNTTSIVVQNVAGGPLPLLIGQVDDAAFDFVGTTIDITGRDQSASLHAVKNSQTWLNLPGSQIVQQLAGMCGLGCTADASALPAGKQVTQNWARTSDGISPAMVIQKLAEFDGARWWVKNGILNYRMLNSPQGIYTLNYVPGSSANPIAADFMTLVVKANIPASQQVQVTVKSWHPRMQQVYMGMAMAGGRVAGTQTYEFHVANLLQDHAQQHAQARAAEFARHGLSLSAEVVGDPTIDVAMGLQLSGTGYFDQMYQIDSIKHSFGMRGYFMSISAKLPTSGGGGSTSAPPTSAPAPTSDAAAGSVIAGSGGPQP